jgi:hypothetical protein
VWTLDVGAPGLQPGQYFGGSFQLRVARDVLEAIETVPQLDGLHIVQTIKGHLSIAYCFIHADGETAALPVEMVLEDDWATALADATPRMTLA